MTTENRIALEVQGLSKQYGTEANRITVLNDVNMVIHRGEFDAVMGSSGSGKSTLLHVLAGLISADVGEIRVGGVSISAMSDNEVTCFRRRRIADFSGLQFDPHAHSGRKHCVAIAARPQNTESR